MCSWSYWPVQLLNGFIYSLLQYMHFKNASKFIYTFTFLITFNFNFTISYFTFVKKYAL